MIESDAIESLAALGDVFASMAAVYFSVTFAYVSVAYLVGRALSRFQCLSVSLMYIAASFIFGGSTIGYAEAWFVVKAKNKTALDEVWLMRDIGWVPIASILILAITSLGLYFMYDVRRKSER